jgi:hypothetical protein
MVLAVVAIAEAAGCWALTPRLGLMGAVWACLGAAVIQFAGTAMILVIHFPRRPLSGQAALNFTDA